MFRHYQFFIILFFSFFVASSTNLLAECGQITSWAPDDSHFFGKDAQVYAFNNPVLKYLSQMNDKYSVTVADVYSLGIHVGSHGSTANLTIYSYESEAQAREAYGQAVEYWEKQTSWWKDHPYAPVEQRIEREEADTLLAAVYYRDSFEWDDPQEIRNIYFYSLYRGCIIQWTWVVMGEPVDPDLIPLISSRLFERRDQARSLIDSKCPDRFSSIAIWADPHVSPYSSEVAIIPGDSRFPGRYQFTLRNYNGQVSAGEELTVSIADSGRARLEGGGKSGSRITVTTDDHGHATVDYIYLGSPKFGDTPFEDTLTVWHDTLSAPVEAKVSVGLDIEIIKLSSPQRDTGVFPKILGMRLQVGDAFRPNMDLRAYLSELEKISGHEIGMEVSVEWLDRPRREFMDQFQAIFPNYGNDEPPELYDGLGVVNYGDNNHTEIIVEALNSPQVTFGVNTLPAITFGDPGNFWFNVYIDPVILSSGQGSSRDYIRGAKQNDTGMMFSANVLAEAESVFQSVVCSVKPTSQAQFAAMTLFIDNPYFNLIPPNAAVKMMAKASGIICDYMRGNYATAAINMASLGADGLEEAYTSGTLEISLEQYLKLGKIIRLNQAYSKFDNLKGYSDIASAGSSSSTKMAGTKYSIRSNSLTSQQQSRFFENHWPDDLSFTEYQDMINKTLSGEMSYYSDLTGWQIIGIITDGAVSLTAASDDSENFSHDGVHVYLLPWEANSLNIETDSGVDIYRFYKASDQVIFTAGYNFTGTGEPTLLNLSLQGIDLKIDNGADGSIDDRLSPDIEKVDTARATLKISTNQEMYQPGDTFILSAALENPGDFLLVDVYLTVTDPAGNIFSFPDITPGYSPLVRDFELPGNFVLPETTIFSFPVSQGFAGAGQFRIDAFLTYPNTMDTVGGNISSKVISFP